MKAHIEEMYGKQRKEHNIEKYILWVSTLLLTIWVYLHSFSCLCLQKSRGILRKFELTATYNFTAVQGHPR